MLAQTGTALVFDAMFTAAKAGATGLTVTVDVWGPDGTELVTADDATEVGDGLYTYTLAAASNTTAGNYRAVFKTSDTSVDFQSVPALWIVGQTWVAHIDDDITSRADGSDYTAARAAKLDNLDAEITSRLAATDYTDPPTSATIASDVWDEDLSSHTTAGTSGKDLSTAAAISPPTAADVADAVWDEAVADHATVGSTGKDLATAAAVTPAAASDIADAVWDEALSGHTTTGTAGKDLADAAAISPPAASDIADAVWDEAAADHTTTGSTGADLADAAGAGGGSAPTAADIADAVWDETLSDHDTTGTTGKQLAAAGAAGDPWSTVLPGDYTSTEAGAILNAIQNKTALLTDGTEVTLVAPVTENGKKIALIRGDDYQATDGRALKWKSNSWPVLTGATISLEVRNFGDATTQSFDGSVLDTDQAQVELTSVQTAALSKGPGSYALVATLSDGDVVTLISGLVTAEDKP